ncbi:MAG: DUF938 domain-containing protein [Croceibacterium sp.]
MKRIAPAAARNRDPISAVLTEELAATGTVLEIASGSGEHAVHFARTYPALVWQPSDPDADALASIADWREDGGFANLLPPLKLDVTTLPWPIARADAIVCINMVHISPARATEALLEGAAEVLAQEGPLVLYGPFLERAVQTAPSNLAFDISLKARDPRWGLREAEWIDQLAAEQGFSRTRRVKMPANNLVLVYRRRQK